MITKHYKVIAFAFIGGKKYHVFSHHLRMSPEGMSKLIDSTLEHAQIEIDVFDMTNRYHLQLVNKKDAEFGG